MNLKPYIPSGPKLVQETIVVLGGVLIAAFILSRFPRLRDWVAAQSITVKDDKGVQLW